MDEDLFSSLEPMKAEDEVPADRPLADRMRPRSLGEVVGQEHLLGERKVPHRGTSGQPSPIHDPLGTSRSWQDDVGSRHRQ